MHSLRVTMTKNIITWPMLKRTRLLRQLRPRISSQNARGTADAPGKYGLRAN